MFLCPTCHKQLAAVAIEGDERLVWVSHGDVSGVFRERLADIEAWLINFHKRRVRR